MWITEPQQISLVAFPPFPFFLSTMRNIEIKSITFTKSEWFYSFTLLFFLFNKMKERGRKSNQHILSFSCGRRIHFSFQIHCLNAFGMYSFILWQWQMLYPSKNKTNLIETERRKFSKENHTFSLKSFLLLLIISLFQQSLWWAQERTERRERNEKWLKNNEWNNAVMNKQE